MDFLSPCIYTILDIYIHKDKMLRPFKVVANKLSNQSELILYIYTNSYTYCIDMFIIFYNVVWGLL